MLLQRLTDFVLLNRRNAIGVAFASAFIPLLGTLGMVVTAFVTLRKGVYEGTLVLAAATLPIVIMGIASPGASLPDFALSAFDITLIMLLGNLLTWVFAVLLRQYSSWSVTLECAALVSAISIAIVHLIYPDVQAWWATRLAHFFSQATQGLGLEPDESARTVDKLVALTKVYATGVVVVCIVFNALTQLFLARWWQAAIFNPGGLRRELYTVRLSQIAGAVFIIGLILSYWGNALVADVMPVIYLVFALAGFCLLHMLMLRFKLGWLWLSLIYLGVIIAPIGLVVIALIALVDTWVDLRRLFAKQFSD